MHDWWLAQCAAAAGHIAYLPRPTVRYRQHGANVVGARGFAGIVRAALARPRTWWRRGFANFVAGVEQADTLRRRLAALDTPEARAAADVADRYLRAVTGAGGPVRRVARVAASGVRPDPVLFYLIFLARVAAYDAAPGAARPTAAAR
jgi:hypothetical protein